MRQLRLAKVLEDDNENLAYKPRNVVAEKSKYASVQAQEVEDERDDAYDLGLTDSSGWAKRVNRDYV